MIEENPHMKNTDISKLLGMEWRTIPQELRQPHIDKEARERESYRQEISEWRKQQELKKKIDAATQNMSSLMNCEGGREQIPPLPRSQSLPAEIKSISIPPCPVTVTPTTTTRKVLQRYSFCVTDRRQENLGNIIGQRARNQVWPSLVSFDSSSSQKINNGCYFPSSTRSNTPNGQQNFRCPTLVPPPPLFISEPKLVSPCLAMRKSNINNNQVFPSSNSKCF